MPFGFGPAIVLALLWYFGYYKNRSGRGRATAPAVQQPATAGSRRAGSGGSNRSAIRVRPRPSPRRPMPGGSGWMRWLGRARSTRRFPPRRFRLRRFPLRRFPRSPTAYAPSPIPRPHPRPHHRLSPPFPSTLTPRGKRIRGSPIRRQWTRNKHSWRRPTRSACTPNLSSSRPRPRAGRSRPARVRLDGSGCVAILVLGITLAGLGIADVSGATISVAVYVGAALLVVGLTLVAATWFGRARGILPVGLVLLLALLSVTVAETPNQAGRLEPYGQLRHAGLPSRRRRSTRRSEPSRSTSPDSKSRTPPATARGSTPAGSK